MTVLESPETDDVKCVADLAFESHQMAREKGWWDEDRCVVDQWNNFNAEVSEAWEEFRHERIATWYATPPDDPFPRKPEGFWVELADLCIRIGDTMSAMGWKEKYIPPDRPATFELLIGCLHTRLSQMTKPPFSAEWSKDAPDLANKIIMTCICFAKEHNHNLWHTISAKMQFNATRAYRHGNLVA